MRRETATRPEESKAEIENLERKNELLISRINSLREQLTQKDHEILAQKTRISDLQEYLNLFLNFSGYKVFRFLKGLFVHPAPPPKISAKQPLPGFEEYQYNMEPHAEELKRQSIESCQWTVRPSFSIVTAVYRPPLQVLAETVHSVLHQTYDNWIWNIADASGDDQVWQCLLQFATGEPRLRVTRLTENKSISENFNAALREAKNDFAVLLDHDDTLAPHALFEAASWIRNHPEVDFLYSDSDKIDEKGKRCFPFFKPDWSPEAMLSINLMSQLSIFRRSLLDRVGYFSKEMDGAQDWDLFLRIAEETNRIAHIPKILYHWRKSAVSTAQSTDNKPAVRLAQAQAIGAHLARIGIAEPEVKFDSKHPVFHAHPITTWKMRAARQVSIVIPSLNHAGVLQCCLDSLFNLTNYPDYEIVLVDTGSTQPEAWSLYERYEKEHRFRVIRYEGDFNFGKACNTGAHSAEGSLLLFLNNDTEILDADWLERMAQCFEIPEVGVVGARLLYPEGSIQHAGVIVGMGGLAAHVFSNRNENITTIFGSDGWYRNYSAVTAACMMVSRSVFEQQKGFDEEFRLNWSDVDLCLRIRGAGYRIVYTPLARLIHHESMTHRRRIPRSDFLRAAEKWLTILRDGDPYFNPNLSYRELSPYFKLKEAQTGPAILKEVLARLPEKEIIVLPDDLTGF